MPPRTWVAGETDMPTFCLVLDSGGVAHLAGGFQWLNPLRWRYDTLSGQLALTIPKLDSAGVHLFAYATHLNLGPASFDSVTKTALFSVRAGAPVWFLTYPLGLPSELDSTNYAIARRRCGLPARR